MPNVLVRDLDDDVLKQLKAAAKANHRSLQADIIVGRRGYDAGHDAVVRRNPFRLTRNEGTEDP